MDKNQVRDRIVAMHAIAKRLQDAYVLVSVTIDSAKAKTVRGRCRHGADHVLWREVDNVVSENLADRQYIGETGIPHPEEWTRVKDVFTTVEDVHPVIEAGRVDEAHPCVACVFCGRSDVDMERDREPFDLLGYPRRRGYGR